MLFVGCLMALAAGVWFVLALRYNDMVVGSAIFLTVTSTFTSDFFAVQTGSVTLTLDRVWIVCLMIQLAYNIKFGRFVARPLQTSDICLAAFLGWLIIRTLMEPLGEQVKGQPSTVMHLLNGYLIPALLYWLIRFSRVDEKSIKPAVVILLVFGVYLGFTAVLEIAKMWSLVFPKHIADPTIGIHFGRARGPMIQSVRLGICLNLCLAVLWTCVWWLNPKSKWVWGAVIAISPILLLGILLTYTRSIWMGTVAIIIISMLTLLQGKVRAMALGGLFVSTVVAGLIVGPSLVAFKREYSEAETRESTYMRAAFAYVSWQMFFDRPIIGFGFNQFQVYNRPYLDDRTTNIRLESIRGYVHHNSYASILVDLGLIGGVLYSMVVIAFGRTTVELWRNQAAPRWARATASLTFSIAAVHAIQMAFHEVSFSTIEYTAVAISLGLCQACRDDFQGAAVSVAKARVPYQPVQSRYQPGYEARSHAQG
jgi:O-antigen ligase